MECPTCKYKTVTTNICRTCLKKDEWSVQPIMVATKMEYTGWVKKCGENRRRKYTPKDAEEAMRLWQGCPVIFEEG